MRPICASVLALSLLVTGAWAQSALPPGGRAGVAKAQTISTFEVVSTGVLLLGAGAFFISTERSTTSSGISFGGGNGETLLTPNSVATTTTTTS